MGRDVAILGDVVPDLFKARHEEITFLEVE